MVGRILEPIKHYACVVFDNKEEHHNCHLNTQETTLLFLFRIKSLSSFHSDKFTKDLKFGFRNLT